MGREPSAGGAHLRVFALAAGGFVLFAIAIGWTGFGPALRWLGPDVVAAGELDPGPHGVPRTLPPRNSCASITGTDLRSPEEGLWFERNCVTPTAHRPASSTTCNRSEIDTHEFEEITPGLYIYRGSRSDHSYLWYASNEGCYDLVSSRLVSAVCADRTVTFRWGNEACAQHGGILVRVNGR